MTEQTRSTPDASTSSQASREGSERRSSPAAPRASGTVGKANRATVRCGQGRNQLQAGPGHHGQGPLAPAHQPGPVVPGVVLHQAPEVGQHRPGPEHRLEPQQLGPGGPVADDVQASGVGGDGAPHRGRVPAGDVHTVGPPGRRGGPLQAGQGHPGADGDLAGPVVHPPQLLQTDQAEDHLAAEWDPAADQAGVPALGHHGQAEFAADGDHPGHLGGGPRPDHRRRVAHEPPGPVGGVGADDLRVHHHMGPHDRLQPGDARARDRHGWRGERVIRARRTSWWRRWPRTWTAWRSGPRRVGTGGWPTAPRPRVARRRRSCPGHPAPPGPGR